ncbi:MAG: ABC-type transport auxiliary lipoprotein family protein [Pseudomonadales bacterium]
MKQSPALPIVLLAAALLAGCVSVDVGGGSTRQVRFVLEDARPDMTRRDTPAAQSLVLQGFPGNPLASSLSMAYATAPGQREVYQLSTWVQRPTQALLGLLRQRLERRGALATVSILGEGVGGDLLLGIAVEDIYHDAAEKPGVARLTVRADLINRQSRTLLARRTFAATARLAAANPAAFTRAMGEATATLFDELVPWLEASAGTGAQATE